MRNGFSLVELSIVLVILGLLVGGVLSGQSLIKAAEIRTLNTQITQFITAQKSFQDKYFAIPGDMTNAQSFWGADPTTYCSNGVGTGMVNGQTTTCNGNGDGILNGLQMREAYAYWQHLSNAGLIEGKFTGQVYNLNSDSNAFGGASSCGCYNSKAGINGPVTKISPNAGYIAQYDDATDTATYPHASNVYFIGNDSIDSNKGGFITAQDLWNLDTKMDDGRVGTGMVQGQMWSCGSNNNAATATYNLTDTSKNCYMMVQVK